MDNAKNTDCCTSTQELNHNTNCCPSNGNSKKRSASMKQKIGLSIFSIALIFALNTAFKGVNGSNKFHALRLRV